MKALLFQAENNRKYFQGMNPCCQVINRACSHCFMHGNKSIQTMSLSILTIQWPFHCLQTWVGGAHCQSSPLH